MKSTMLAAAGLALTVTGALSDDGARAYHLQPQGTDIISLTMNAIETQIGGSTFHAGVLTPSFRTAIDVGGNAGNLLIGLPLGNVSADLDTGLGGIVKLENDPAIGDLFVGAYVGLVGSPSLAPMEFAQFKPGFRMGVAGKLFMPTGDYDQGRLINLGLNRWTLEASLPMSYVLADSMIDPALTTFEIVPKLVLLSDNNAPYGGADTLSTDPLFALEGHVSHNFSSTVWASLDGEYIAGGETRSDGVSNNDAKEAVTLGATLGLVLSPSFALRARYNEVVYSRNDNDGRGLEISAAYIF